MVQTIKNLPAMWETWVNPWAGKIPWRWARQPTPGFLPGEAPWKRSLADYSSWGLKESDASERLSTVHQGLLLTHTEHTVSRFWAHHPSDGSGTAFRRAGPARLPLPHTSL